MVMPQLQDAGVNPPGSGGGLSSPDFLFLKRDFGAKGDYPVTDDTAAIQAWLNAGSLGGFYKYPVLVAEPGAYKFTSTLTFIPTTPQPTLNIIGAGSLETAFVASGGAFGPSAPLFQIGDATHLVQMNVRGLVLNGNGASYSTGTLTTVNGSITVEGVGTAFTAAMAGKMILINGIPYRIDTVTDPTHLETVEQFQQTGAAGLTYVIPMGQNLVTGATVGWDVFDKGGSRYDDMGAWYCDTGLKWEGIDGSLALYSCSFFNNNIAIDGNLTVGGLFPEAVSFFGGDYSFSYDVFKFDSLATITVNLNWYGTETAQPAFGGTVWSIKNAMCFLIDGCTTDSGPSTQSGRLVSLVQCTGGAIRGNFFAKGGSSQVIGIVDLFDATDVVVEGNFFRAGDATDVAISLAAASARNRIGPNAGLLTTFTTPVVDASTATGDNVNVYIAQAHP